MKPFLVMITVAFVFVTIPLGIRYLIEFASGIDSESQACRVDSFRKLKRRILLEVYLVFGLGAVASTLLLNLGELALQLTAILWSSAYTAWVGRAAVRLRLLHDRLRVA